MQCLHRPFPDSAGSEAGIGRCWHIFNPENHSPDHSLKLFYPLAMLDTFPIDLS
jgi:hypothetical protein